MLIIFGMRSKVKDMGTLLVVCRRCNTPAANRLMRIDRWITLFFIPVIPVSKKYRLTCTFCGGTTSISKQDALQFEAAAQQQAFGQGAPGFPQVPPYPAGALGGTEPSPYPAAALPDTENVPPPPMDDTGGDWPQPAPVASRPGNWPQVAPKPAPPSGRPFSFPAAPAAPTVAPPTVSDEP